MPLLSIASCHPVQICSKLPGRVVSQNRTRSGHRCDFGSTELKSDGQPPATSLDGEIAAHLGGYGAKLSSAVDATDVTEQLAKVPAVVQPQQLRSRNELLG